MKNRSRYIALALGFLVFSIIVYLLRDIVSYVLVAWDNFPDWPTSNEDLLEKIEI